MLCLLTGCRHLHEAQKTSALYDDCPPMRQAMLRRNEFIYLSKPELDPHKPVLLLLHGATDDPGEMLGIFREYQDTHNVVLFAFNYHQSIKRVGADFDAQMKTLRDRMRELKLASLTVVDYSYSASVFRQAVLFANDPELFDDVSLIQLVPTAAGSYFAWIMRWPVSDWIISAVSAPSAVENPYGRISKRLWGDAANQKFYAIIPRKRVTSILIEGDSNSVERLRSKEIHRRYKNGVGGNVVVIPKDRGATHEYFPSEPFALGYLRKVIEENAATQILPASSLAKTNLPKVNVGQAELGSRPKLSEGSSVQ